MSETLLASVATLIVATAVFVLIAMAIAPTVAQILAQLP